MDFLPYQREPVELRNGTYLPHRVTNAASESINSKIQWAKYTLRGFRDKENFKTAIYFHCGGLDLMPSH